LHPVFTADRSVVVTLAQARGMRDEIGSACVGVVVDSFNTWWDPALSDEVALLGEGGHLVGVQVADWLEPSDDRPVADRGVPGDGVINLPGFLTTVRSAGFAGPVEIEVISSRLARLSYADADRVLARALAVLSAAREVGAAVP
jgi:sugar phosphate isomerase/epimerase